MQFYDSTAVGYFFVVLFQFRHSQAYIVVDRHSIASFTDQFYVYLFNTCGVCVYFSIVFIIFQQLKQTFLSSHFVLCFIQMCWYTCFTNPKKSRKIRKKERRKKNRTASKNECDKWFNLRTSCVHDVRVHFADLPHQR